MEDKYYNLPNVLPEGAVQPVAEMDLIMAKLKHDSKIQKSYLKNFVEKNKD